MIDKDPNNWTLFQEMLFVISFAGVGGFIKFWRQRLKDKDIKFRSWRLWFEFFIELTTSAFVGLLTFYACRAMDLNDMWTACIVGMAGHEGARMFHVIYKLAEKKGLGL